MGFYKHEALTPKNGHETLHLPPGNLLATATTKGTATSRPGVQKSADQQLLLSSAFDVASLENKWNPRTARGTRATVLASTDATQITGPLLCAGAGGSSSAGCSYASASSGTGFEKLTHMMSQLGIICPTATDGADVEMSCEEKQTQTQTKPSTVSRSLTRLEQQKRQQVESCSASTAGPLSSARQAATSSGGMSPMGRSAPASGGDTQSNASCGKGKGIDPLLLLAAAGGASSSASASATGSNTRANGKQLTPARALIETPALMPSARAECRLSTQRPLVKLRCVAPELAS